MQMPYDDLSALTGAWKGVAARLVGSAALPHAESVLSAAERARRDGFGAADRRRHFALGRLAARTLAGERLGVPPGAVPLGVAADGAVEVEGADLHLSISHGGGGAAAVGLAAIGPRPVGVDVEPIRARRADLWTRILRPDERPALDALGGPSDESQTLLWSLKEAVLKGQRTGLRAGARSVRLELGDGADLSSGVASAQADASGRWALRYARRGDLWVVVTVLRAASPHPVPLPRGEGAT